MPSPFDSADPLLAAFLALARDTPDRPLVRSPRRHAVVRDILDLAQALAPRVHALAPDAGGLVAVAAANGPAFLAAVIGVRMAGHAVLLLDADAPAPDTTSQAAALGAAATLTARSAWPSSADDLDLQPGVGAGRTALPRAAIVKLTSGATGAPRGVVVSAAAALADEAALFETMDLRADDRLIASVPMSHSYGFTTLALSALVRGLTLVVPEDPTRLAAPLAAAAACGATVFPTTPAYLSPLVALSAPPAVPPSVRVIISAGAPLSAAVAARVRHATGRAVHTFYGSSECGGIAYDPRGDAAERGTVGAPVRDVRISIAPVDGRDAGEGLIVVHSPAVAETYLPLPDARLADGRFETADLGRLRDGEVEILGRASRTINVRGRKVHPVEVEAAIRRLEAVADVVVVGVTAPDGTETVRAVVAGRAPAVTYDAIRDWCLAHLAPHKVPRSVVLVDAIRYTSRGKVDTAWLTGLGDD